MWPFNLFSRTVARDAEVRAGAVSPFKGADRVEHLTERDAYGNPKRYTVYGICSNNVSLAVVHWQGWEDAGWRLIPVKDLAPFRYPHMERLGFKYCPSLSVHQIGEDTPGEPCTVWYYKRDTDRILACIRFKDGSLRMVDTDSLYGVKDPQFF